MVDVIRYESRLCLETVGYDTRNSESSQPLAEIAARTLTYQPLAEIAARTLIFSSESYEGKPHAAGSVRAYLSSAPVLKRIAYIDSLRSEHAAVNIRLPWV